MLKRYTLLLAPLLSLLVACTSSEPPATPTSLDSFGANPNPAPANIPVVFSWSVTGDDLTCAVDVDNNGTTEYTVQDCSSSSRASHVYGVQGAYTAQLTVTGADGVTQKKTTLVGLEVENQAPSVLSFDVRQGSKENSIVFAWTVSDSGADTLNCRLDADGDGNWEFDGLCGTAPGMVGAQAVASRQVEITLPTGTYLSIFEVYDAYSSTRISKRSRSPQNRLPQITSLETTAGSNLVGTVSFNVTDPDRDDMICSLTVQGIGQFVYKNCSSITRTYTFPKEGAYQVKLEVIDEYKGISNKLAEIKFETSRPPPPIPLIATGGLHSCRILPDGITYCWGFNGVSPNDITDHAFDSNIPVAVSMPSGVTFSQITAGAFHTCALDSDDTAYCWGINDSGRLGNGSTTESTTPVAVSMPGGITFTQISAGGGHTCALGNNNVAYCWGDNYYGQLGDGNTINYSTTPVAVSLPSGVSFSQISAGGTHTCALGNNNVAYCWGENGGQLGNGTYTDSAVPVPVPGGITFTQISAGGRHTCALGNDSNAYCWGGNYAGQLGNGSTDGSNSPVAVSLPSGVSFSRISAGGDHTCALGNASNAYSNAYCWGYNASGQLGNGYTTDRTTPVPVSFPSDVTVTQIDAGGTVWGHTCALGSNDEMYCWGSNIVGQLGKGSYTDSSMPSDGLVFP